MGWKTTLDITREDLLREVVRRLAKASDRQLEEVLERLVDEEVPSRREGLYGFNFRIVEEYNPQNEFSYDRQGRP
jgi:hypothetical protein